MCRTILSLLRTDCSLLHCTVEEKAKERKRLRKVFKDLAQRCDLPYPGIDMLEFLKLTELPGLLGEQFFHALDRNEDGILDTEEFLSGLERVYNGTMQEIVQLLFLIMDFGHKGFITQADVRCALTHLPCICPKCGKSIEYAWDIDTQLAAIFADSQVLSYEHAETLLIDHSELLTDISEAIMSSLPTVFADAVGRTTWKTCEGEECLLEEPLILKPLKVDGRRFFFGVKNECLYGYRSLDQAYVKKLIILKDLFICPVGDLTFELKNRAVTYTFEASTEAERDQWVDCILTEKRFRWFDDFYVTKEKLGCGAYGQVFKAVSRASRVTAAVKIISKEALSEKAEERLRREISILRYVQHPNLLRLYDVFETFERIYIVTELLEGGTLFEYLEKRAFNVTEEFTKKVVSDIATGLLYLHSNSIVHRDLKLENVMLRKESEGETDAILIDFGLSQFLGPHQTASEAVGTLKYVAPEVISRLNYDSRADCWSLGVMIYILLHGKMPFYGKTDQDVAMRILKHRINFTDEKWRNFSPESADVVSHLLVRKVDQRWSLRDVLHSDWLTEGLETHIEESQGIDAITA